MLIDKVKQLSIFTRAIILALIIHVFIIKFCVFVFPENIKDSVSPSLIFIGSGLDKHEFFSDTNVNMIAKASNSVNDLFLFPTFSISSNKLIKLSIDKPQEQFKIADFKVNLKSLFYKKKNKPLINEQIPDQVLKSDWSDYNSLKFNLR